MSCTTQTGELGKDEVGMSSVGGDDNDEEVALEEDNDIEILDLTLSGTELEEEPSQPTQQHSSTNSSPEDQNL